MAECLDFWIGISSIVFAEINKCIFLPPFFKKMNTLYILDCYKQTHETNKQKLSDGTNNLLKSCCKEFTTENPHPFLPSETPSETKRQRYDSGGQQNCSVAKYLCNSQKENQQQILALTSSLNNYQEESLLNE